MKQLNILPIEDFLNKAKIAVRSNQKNLILSIKEVVDLQHSLSLLLLQKLEQEPLNKSQQIEKIQAKMDGGKF
jgi:hypothetical protein